MAVFATIAIYLAAWNWASGGRVEFCPYTLQTRRQAELLFPLTTIPIFRSGWSTGHYPLTQTLIDRGYWAPSQTEPPQWRLECRWNQQWRDGHSNVHRWLAWNAGLREWTEEHPDVAEVFWPQILRLLRSGSPRDRDQAEVLLSIAQSIHTRHDYQEAVEATLMSIGE